MPRISALCKRGILEKHASHALCRAGIHTAEDLLWLTSGSVHGVAEKSKLTEEEIFGVVAAILRQITPAPRRGSDLFSDWQQRDKIIKTGSSALDHLLNGGIFTSELCELAGGSGTGKTQICYSLAIRAARDCGFAVLFIDSGTSFSGARVNQLLQHAREGNGSSLGDAPVQDAAVLMRIRRTHARDAADLLRKLGELERDLEAAATGNGTSPSPFYRKLRLVVVDSLGFLFASAVGGKQTVGHSLLVSVSTAMQRIMSRRHIAFVVTNHTTEYNGKVHPALGDTWSHLPCVSMV